jgi:hypothetical protein
MASLDIENIGRRNFIRRQTSIRFACDTPVEKIEEEVGIIKAVLYDHEGMQPGLPPRVFFSEFNPDSLHIMVSYWYHPPDRWESWPLTNKSTWRSCGVLPRRASASRCRRREPVSMRRAIPPAVSSASAGNRPAKQWPALMQTGKLCARHKRR